ncbi:phosphatase PAP2 family protein [Halochromatium glycolicum]|uniref:undecaprenyl-diphosphate phosphatase n=1 Tax=Halochromatium glycolicum TaxID=85075 RepID=A0AAJ0U4B3_9GAMM|nr:phosphatase PAP2 family protein [Halochromatium glycolicum]MBK1705053.1 phosphoesterase PA-phosphatase [Halochromatium glycolicum]
MRSASTSALRQALALGADRDPVHPPGGAGWLLGWALICSVIAGALWQFGATGYHSGFLTLNTLFALLPSSLWQWLTVLGDERVALTLGLLLSYRHPRVFWTLICAALVAIAYSRGLKPLIDAPRPPAVLAAGSFEVIGDAHRSQSFPSGHSVTAGVFFGVLAYYARRSSLRCSLLVLATLAGLSRVAVGVHWPVDVMAGLAGGGVAALAGGALARRSPWGIYDEGVHRAFVVLAGFAAIGLLFDDGGYPAATRVLQLLGGVALIIATLQYLIWPLRRRLVGK